MYHKFFDNDSKSKKENYCYRNRNEIVQSYRSYALYIEQTSNVYISRRTINLLFLFYKANKI